MTSSLQDLLSSATTAFTQATTASDLETLRVAYLGRKGALADAMNTLATLSSSEEKRAFGQEVNHIKEKIEQAFADASLRIAQIARDHVAQKEMLDITLPPLSSPAGHLHVTSQAIEEISAIFAQLGFSRARHPEVDWDYYAFASLNMPKDHPARDEWETFFVGDAQGNVVTGPEGKMVLTPHTSNGQVREMRKGVLPIRMISLGKCYRRQVSARHLPMFHQFEGLMIDERVTIAELRGVFDFFVRRFFGAETRTRLRPFHFRFTEPSFELDISCAVCKGKGSVSSGAKCKLCKAGWLELGGAGMVHPRVLENGGLDPKKYQGFAFGWGLERTLMMKSGASIDDIRVLYQNDLRFLTQW